MSKPISRRRFLAEGGKTILTVGALSGATGTLLSACGPAATTTSGNVEVSYTYPTFTPVPDVQQVQDALNKILQARYNVTLKLHPTDAGAYDQKQKLAVAAGDVQDPAPPVDERGAHAARPDIDRKREVPRHAVPAQCFREPVPYCSSIAGCLPPLGGR